MTICLTSVQSYHRLGRSDLEPVLTLHATPHLQSRDYNSGVWQLARIYDQLQCPAVPSNAFVSFIATLQQKECPLGKLDSLSDYCKNDCKGRQLIL